MDGKSETTDECPGICQFTGERCPPECTTTYQPCAKARAPRTTPAYLSVNPRAGLNRLCEDPNCKFKIRPHYHENNPWKLSDEARRDIEEIERATIRRNA